MDTEQRNWLDKAFDCYYGLYNLPWVIYLKLRVLYRYTRRFRRLLWFVLRLPTSTVEETLEDLRNVQDGRC
jgi:hypothetical protein